MVAHKYFVNTYRGWERHWRKTPSLSDCLGDTSDLHTTKVALIVQKRNAIINTRNNIAEARLAARRQARAEAREIRMRELEKQQREQEENADRVYDMYTDPVTRSTAAVRVGSGVSGRASMLSNSSYHSSRRSSEDSLEDTGSLRDLRLEIRELEEKFRKAMITNAQLDNDKASFTYQIELLKDRLEELEQDHSQLQREYRDKCREYEQLKRAAGKLKDDFACMKILLEERDTLISEAGLVIVQCEDDAITDDENEGDNNINPRSKKVLVSIESAEVLQNAGEGSLDVRLKKFSEEKKDLEDQIRSLRLELDEEKHKLRKNKPNSNLSINANTNSILMNGPESETVENIDVLDIQRETTKQLADYKFKLQKAEQDVASLQAAVARLESQVIRYKAAAEASEKAEDELKVEKRKLQREARESQSRVEELETANSHLQKRLDKLKNAKSALLKEL